MKKAALIIVLIFSALLSRSQISWMARAGYNYGNVKAEYLGINRSTSAKSGFNLGIGLKAFFDYNLYFTPQLGYSLKSYQVSYGADSSVRSSNTSIHYVEIPLLFQMYVNPDASNRFFFQYGPSLNFAISGKETVTLQNGSTEKRSIRFGDVYYGRWEATLVAALGMEFSNKITATASFNLGLTNISNNDEGPKLKTRVIGLNLGYYFR